MMNISDFFKIRSTCFYTFLGFKVACVLQCAKKCMLRTLTVNTFLVRMKSLKIVVQLFYFLHTSSLLAFLNPIKLPLLSSSIMLHEAGVI